MSEIENVKPTTKRAGRPPSNKSKATTKKVEPKEVSAEVVEVKSVEESLVNAIETVVEKLTNKEEVKVEQPKKLRGIGEIPSHEQFTVKSLRNNLVVYKDSRSGTLYKWNDYGDNVQMPWSDILNMRSSSKHFVDNMMICFEDEEIINAFKLKEKYEEVFSKYDNDMIINGHVHELQEVIPNLPHSLKMSLLDRAREVAHAELESGEFKLLESTSRIKMIKELLGLDLNLLIKKD